ncbi:MAG: DUF1566 domain-containing protein [Steroidobacteraceae bacterium]
MYVASLIRSRVIFAFSMCCLALSLATAAGAVDLRDWGRKFPTAERFVVLSQFGNQAVLDKETQLVWQRQPFQSQTSWIVAKVRCLSLVLGGRRGWRLPSVHELQSLTRPDAPIGVLALPTGHPFVNVQASSYWTETRFVGGSGQPTGGAFAIQFHVGGLFELPPTETPRFNWCVRGGGPISEH